MSRVTKSIDIFKAGYKLGKLSSRNDESLDELVFECYAKIYDDAAAATDAAAAAADKTDWEKAKRKRAKERKKENKARAKRYKESDEKHAKELAKDWRRLWLIVGSLFAFQILVVYLMR